jgi:hypothetical protein
MGEVGVRSTAASRRETPLEKRRSMMIATPDINHQMPAKSAFENVSGARLRDVLEPHQTIGWA